MKTTNGRFLTATFCDDVRREEGGPAAHAEDADAKTVRRLF